MIFALLGAALSSLAFFNTKERVEQSEKTPSLKESIQMVAKNKLLLIVIMAAVLAPRWSSPTSPPIISATI